MNLSEFFESVAYKRLAAVDLPHTGSNQHELNGSRPLGKVLGYEKRKGPIMWRHFSDNHGVESWMGEYTWYDAREKSSSRTGRSEWRFYYTGKFLERAHPGDVFIVAKRTSGELLGLVFDADSTWLKNVSELFGLSASFNNGLLVIDRQRLSERTIVPDDPLVHALGLDESAALVRSESKNKETRNREGTEFKFRPAARLIATIGQDLIKDPPAALMELVKNSYDADSTTVSISIVKEAGPADAIVRFKVADNGHGMSHDTVVNSWLVPATPYKARQKYSPNGRRMQGNKGIGRYAAFVLGSELLLKTVGEETETTIFLDWNEFEKWDFLDQVPVLVESKRTVAASGTSFDITGDSHHAAEWDESAINYLRLELRKLISPFRDESDPFAIELGVRGFPAPFDNFTEVVEPLSLIEFFDYRLSGTINEEGEGTLLFENHVGDGEIPRDVELQLELPQSQHCGKVEIDLRVFDRDPEAIDELIQRGLRDPETGIEPGKREARALLDASSGISIFRGDFKIRPYGDPGFDWSELDKQRVQNPSLRIGSNQIIGFIKIESEEQSHLEEKSARDGLKENSHYLGLKRVVKAALAELEQRRFVFRREAGRGRKPIKVDQVVNELVDYESAIGKIQDLLTTSNVPASRIAQVREILDETRREKEELVGQIRETIAIYQGQATLGKIIMVILHEGRKPIGYFRDLIPILADWSDRLRQAPNEELLEKLTSRLDNVRTQAGILANLFDRLEPLSVRKRHKATNFSLLNAVTRSFEVFHGEVSKGAVRVEIDPALDFPIMGWEEDFILLFTNLIENSLYWLRNAHSPDGEISVMLISTSSGPAVTYSDNGPGIPDELLQSQAIFDPGFSTKKGGTGLGLAIAGEAAERNGCRLKALSSSEGARFVLELSPGLKH